MDIYSLETYDYELPTELIAQHPVQPRDHSRLLVVDRKTGDICDSYFYRLEEHLGEGHVLVLNETKVIPVRLRGAKKTGSKAEILLLREIDGVWEALVRPARRLKPGAVVELEGGVRAIIVEELDFAGGRLVRFEGTVDVNRFLEKEGEVPLPPYIRRKPGESDKESYQTVYAARPGSAAAPTAGLHFTERLLERLSDRGVKIVKVVLHVGLGTFRPVESPDIRMHRMHHEYYELGPREAEVLNEARATGKKIVAVGTTVVRTLESVYEEGKGFVSGQGYTDKFIYPGYRFKAVDQLITNFHLPRSSLLMLVCAFAGIDLALTAYRYAVEKRYRFFSYGDAMYIL